MAAEFDDIEYEGIADDRSIRIGSDRCFRDYSPSGTVLSLSDDGRAIYTRAVPSFENPPHCPSGENRHPETASRASKPTSDVSSDTAVDPDADGVPLSHGSLLAMGSRPSSSGSSGSSRTPLGRFRRDEQAYERLALQLSSSDPKASASSSSASGPRIVSTSEFRRIRGAYSAIDAPLPPLLPELPQSPPQQQPGDGPPPPSLAAQGKQPATTQGGDGGGGSSMSTSPLALPRPLMRDIPLPASATLPRSVLAAHDSNSRANAEELREKMRYMKSPEWATLSSEEQTKYAHEVFLLKRRVRAVELPREPKPVRIRRRRRIQDKKDEGGSGA
ncbi:hypothetical protein DL766_006335 [Monosporascus sp. MC13-8B]|uniref:HMG box domain-containing protein n=1 Tax=Monosporascus cannonballus TaxID=155416 RepID=A0ABY0H1J5_9PEZI|nr:hypothetical protein DL762_006587 [Monosporascus cannonballus]RYO90176.1 hypothetical protein DL763_005417 [Monosporascus cannonballus]RYP27551.1 hypothetical protein DL766_006335 [Monosporascus sp. MC13-8B]